MSDQCDWKYCPIVGLLSFISKKWVLFIIQTIASGAHSYSEIEKNTAKINPWILSTRLKELQEQGFINKNIIYAYRIKIEYTLTEKWKSFSKEFDKIVDWSVKWM
jgi:DNA-binding HxlR family transcriptional regulator